MATVGDVDVIEKCPGLYCGRTSSLSDCGACPRGYRVNESSEISLCVSCDDSLSNEEWLYLGAMASLSLLAHVFAINFYASKSERKHFNWLSYVSAGIEFFVAAIVSLLLFDPVGSLDVKSCGVRRFSDWYTLFFNPKKPDYISTIHCTQEAVYPLYTIVLTYYFWSLVMFLLLRPIITVKYSSHKSGTLPLFFGLYAIPILVVVHTVLGGFLFYSYPYLLLFFTLWATAAVMNYNDIETPRKLIENSDSLGILIIHCVLYGYSIAAITRGVETELSSLYFLLVPAPVILYMLMAFFTHPRKFTD
ncbi:JNK1/MAPK8-associated membrane protein-like [Corticium candelabrum]|uniref:JNK1/MAPK8-associated membrane protein-like n=1 Tax=Corticium candelabrum TaxID=121492 RepID=UPI002E25888C|nr:JNK1/MAPK8-associated membrane protein-like [Corticium candelabrum]